MLIRHVSLVACLLWGSLAAYGDAASGAGYVFELPGPNIAGAHFQAWGYNANPFNPVFDALGPTSASKVLALPDGSKFYMLGAGGGGLESIDPAFTTFRSINGISGTACNIALTPNGKYLLIASALTCPSAGNNFTGTTSLLYILDTSNDSVLSNSVTLTGVVQMFAVSQDSQTAWILSDSAFGSQVVAMNMSTRAAIGQPFGLPFGGATSITLSPRGLLYVTEVNRIYEINPATLTITSNGEIPIVATPGTLRYEPTGQVAYVVNSTPSLGGVSLIQLNLSTHATNTWPLFNSGVTPPVLDDVFPISSSRVLAFSSSNTTLWDVTPAPFGAAPSTSFGGTFSSSNVLSVAFSNEVPSARFMYALIGNGNQTNIERINLSTSTLDLQSLAILGPGILQFAAVPPQAGAAAFLQYTTSQLIKAGATSPPLTVIVTDGTGRPVYNIPVTYSAADPTTGVIINGPGQTTNANGYATATATVPTAPGTYVVNVTAGGATAAFTLIVPGVNGGGGGPTGGPTQVSIAGGNGDLLAAFSPSPTASPLTVLVVDANGKPLVNTPVNFSIVSGPGNLDNPITTTDANGLASTDFFAQQPQQGVPFQSTDVNASTAVGGVDFVETTYVLNLDGTGEPQVSLVNPSGDANYTVVAGEGDVVTNAITAKIFTSGAITGQTQPIPNISIRIADQNDFTLPGPATCQGSTLSDNSGFANCNLVVTCQAGITLPHIYGMQVVVGEHRVFSARVQVVAGSSRGLSFLAGNNQSGRGGQVLPIDLTALVNDNCSTPIPGQTVTWAVTQGSATISNLKTLSDSGGRVSARVTLGNTPGPVQVTVSITGGASLVFNITNQVTVSSLTLISGDGQTGFINQTVPQPLVFQVKDINGNAVPNANVSFTVTGNGAVNPASGPTDTQGKISTVITAGSTPSTVVVTASYAGFTASGSATIKLPGPSLTPTSFQNAASFQTGLVPCGLAQVSGPGLAPNINGVVLGNPLGIGPLPYTLATVTITVNGIPAPLYYVSNLNGAQQVVFQTPCETIANSPATVAITVNGTTSTITGVQVLIAQPGIFTYAGPNNIQYGDVFAADGSGTVTPSNPAKRGATYFMVATSLGQTSPPVITNSPGIANQNLLANTVVGVANFGVPVNSATYLQGQIGAYLISFTIPTTQNGSPFPTGTNVPLSLGVVIGGQTIFSAPAALPAVQ